MCTRVSTSCEARGRKGSEGRSGLGGGEDHAGSTEVHDRLSAHPQVPEQILVRSLTPAFHDAQGILRDGGFQVENVFDFALDILEFVEVHVSVAIGHLPHQPVEFRHFFFARHIFCLIPFHVSSVNAPKCQRLIFLQINPWHLVHHTFLKNLRKKYT